MADKLELIIKALEEKACVKQKIYRNTLEVFNTLKKLAGELAGSLSEKFDKIDKTIPIEFISEGEFEFHLKFGGDLLVFSMHSNVISFPAEHILFKNNYVKEDLSRKYFGHIMVYNFMADSIKYNRLKDPGYLLARFLLNKDKHFYIEGVRQMNFLYPDIGENEVNESLLKSFIEAAMLAAIDIDLLASPYKQLQVISLGQKLSHQMLSGVEKVGFSMSFEKEE